MPWCHIRIQLELAEVGGPFLLRLGNKAIHTENIYIIITVKSSLLPDRACFSCCSLIKSVFCVAHFIPAKLYCGIINQDSTLVICSNGRCYFTSDTRISAVLTGFRKPDWNTGMGSKVTCTFNKFHLKAGFWHQISICAFDKASVTTCTWAGCLCPFSGSSS